MLMIYPLFYLQIGKLSSTSTKTQIYKYLRMIFLLPDQNLIFQTEPNG